MGTPTKVLIISTLYLLAVLISQWNTFSISYPLSEYEWRYSQSQYVLGDNRTVVMGDGDIYTYAGIRYIQGEDPTKINFEHPPLIKYLYGLSYLLTGKPNWILIPLFYVAIFSFWFIASRVIKIAWVKWLALAMFLGHSTIYMAIPQTMLDFPMTAILLLTTALYLSNRQSATVSKMIALGISAGLLMLSKYPVPLLLMLIVLLYVSLILSRISFKIIILSLIFVVATYVIGYTSYFMHGNSILDFVRFEWWRLIWYLGKTDGPKGMIWQTIFTGRYPAWWAKNNSFVSVSHWNIFWPINLTLFGLSWTIKKIFEKPLFPYQLWIAISLIIYSVGTAAEDRFLVPLIPGFALFGALFIEKLFAPDKNEIINR